MNDNKQCTKCKLVKPLSEFYSNISKRGEHESQCAKCCLEYEHLPEVRERKRLNANRRNHSKGVRPMTEAKDCSAYLGIHIAERVLSKFFDNITRIPMNNPGYDFICGRGFKIDVKSVCRSVHAHHADRWQFTLRKNKVPDYFLLLAFDNRESLKPEHIWLIPGNGVNHLHSIGISVTSLRNWEQYEKPLDRVIHCCNVIRNGGDQE